MREYGQTIIEVLVALTTAVVIVSAATLAVLIALQNSQRTQVQNTATRYAQEGMEFMRFLRDSDFSQFSNLEGTPTVYCLDKGATSVYKANKNVCNNTQSCGDNVDQYSRSIVIEKTSVLCAPATLAPLTPTPINTASRITVTVSWTDSQCPSTCPCHQSKLESCLSDYTIVPTPGDTVTPTPGP